MQSPSLRHSPKRPLRLLELGAGTAAKTGILLKAAARLRSEVSYIPVDVSPDALDAACDSIGRLFPDVELVSDGRELRHPSAEAGTI